MSSHCCSWPAGHERTENSGGGLVDRVPRWGKVAARGHVASMYYAPTCQDLVRSAVNPGARRQVKLTAGKTTRLRITHAAIRHAEVRFSRNRNHHCVFFYHTTENRKQSPFCRFFPSTRSVPSSRLLMVKASSWLNSPVDSHATERESERPKLCSSNK